MATFFASQPFLSHPITTTTTRSFFASQPFLSHPITTTTTTRSFFASQPFLSHTITTTTTRSVYFSSAPPPRPSSESPETSPQHLSAAIAEQTETISIKGLTPNPIKAANKLDSTDWIDTSLTRRAGLGAGLAWAAFLAVGVVSEQMNTRLQVSQEQDNNRNLEEKEQVVLPNGIRYYDLRVGGGASPRPGDLVVINLKGKIMGTGEVFVDTTESNKNTLALVMESRPYSKGLCEGVEYAVRSMRSGGKRRVIVPSNLGFREKCVDFGSTVQIPPFATLEYIIEIDQVSIAQA